VAFDEDLAARIRDLLADEDGVTERRMFGGLAFLVDTHLAIAASGQGGILVRTDPAGADDLLDSTPAEPAIMRGRPMAGWLRVSADGVRTNRQLGPWVRRSVAYARTLTR
jgi:TfoX/Sxy family transcriptional regulator of competence genes